MVEVRQFIQERQATVRSDCKMLFHQLQAACCETAVLLRFVPMLTIYLISAAVGGTLVVLSALSGDGDHDMDGADAGGNVDFDGELDGEVSGHFEGDIHPDVADGALVAKNTAELTTWLPFFSLRFWTYFSAGFGGTGSLLTWLGLAGTTATVGIATSTGAIAGLGMFYTMRAIQGSETDSAATVGDLAGQDAVVSVRITADEPGEIRLDFKGMTVELLARSKDGQELEAGIEVVILDFNGTQAWVTRREQFLTN